MREVDTLTLGAGGGAYPAAFALARAGQQVVMVDPKAVMSGNCLAEGCVPSKAVREVAELRRRSLAGVARGVGVAPGTADYRAVLAHKDAVQQTRYRQHDAELAELAGRLSLLPGTARLLDEHTALVTGPGGEETVRADHLIVATGADVSWARIPGAELCISSHELFALPASVTELPDRLVVIGGGYIGLEVACMWHALGVTVSVLEATGGLLPGMDPDFVALLAGGLDPDIEVLLGASVTGVSGIPGALRVTYSHPQGPGERAAGAVLMAVGRHPVIPEGAEQIGLARAGVGLSVAPTLQTSLSHVYAPGDVNARSMLFHSAVRQSLVAAHNILSGDRGVDRMDFTSVPTTIFTSPEAAFVGLTRASAAAQRIPVVEGSYALAGDSRAQILGEPYGEIRLFFHAESLRLLGGWMVGIDAAQLVGEVGLGVSAGLSAFDLARFADQHPMAAEGISRAARAVAG